MKQTKKPNKTGSQENEPLIFALHNLYGLSFSNGLWDFEPHQLVASAQKSVELYFKRHKPNKHPKDPPPRE